MLPTLTPTMLAEQARTLFYADPTKLAHLLQDHGATIEDLIGACEEAGVRDARRIVTEFVNKTDSAIWLELDKSWVRPLASARAAPLAAVRAKFVCSAKGKVPGDATFVRMHAVYSSDPNSPNKAFTDTTPSGDFSIWIANDKPAADLFVLGREYFFDITPAGA